jgi:hypothetical protein
MKEISVFDLQAVSGGGRDELIEAARLLALELLEELKRQLDPRFPLNRNN